jgi:hypothetical protein
MELYHSGGERVRGDYIRRIIRRSDLAPIPLTLEAEVRVDSGSLDLFEVGQTLKLDNDDEFEILKSELMQNARAQGDSVAAAVSLIGVLKPVAKVTYLKNKAIIKNNASLSEIYTACGAELPGLKGDTSIPRFACLSGEAGSYHIARALQEAGGVLRWKNGRLEFLELDALAQQPVVEEISSAVAKHVESGFLERHDIPAFYSCNENGEIVHGAREKERSARYHPGADEAMLRKMSRCLVLTKTATVKYNASLCAGDRVNVTNEQPLTIMTAATVFAPGSDGDEQTQRTKLWLGRVEPP